MLESSSTMSVRTVSYIATSAAGDPTSSSGDSAEQTSLASTTDSSLSHDQKLIIILSSVLGVLGLLLIAGLVVLIVRYRRQHGPRGASPIDDEEITSWRRSEQEKRREIAPRDRRTIIREVPELPLEHNSSWTWTTTSSSGSIHTIPQAFPVTPAYSPTHVAPNARVGLTDQTVPGEKPFISPPKRRLSKLPPSHARTRSCRSSVSMISHNRPSIDVKSIHPPWYDNYDGLGSDDSYMKEIGGTIGFPSFSTFDDSPTAGGLSPRPQAAARLMTWERRDDIGRAIA